MKTSFFSSSSSLSKLFSLGNCFSNQNQFTFYLFFYLSLLIAIKWLRFNPMLFIINQLGFQKGGGTKEVL